MMSPNRFRRIVVILCFFTLFLVIYLIFGIDRRTFLKKPVPVHHVAQKNHQKQNHPYWMPAPIDDKEIDISPLSLGKHPVIVEALKIWPYKGISSENLSYKRPVRDSRPFGCEIISYDSLDEPKPVSIIIAFHNEFIGNLLRTIFTITETTPDHLLLEILLIDDASTETHLGDFLEAEIDKFTSDKIHLIRLSKRQGLHHALKIGLDKAKAEIVVLMPSFLEPSKGWLEPLLDPVIKDRRTITTPVVEYQHWTFDETATNEILDGRGVFDLKMNVLELPVNISIKNFENPIVTTKIVVGSAEFLKLASNKKAVTGVDGDFLELSLKTWLCLDGRIIKVPCSRFGHSFKESGVHTSLANIGKSFKDKELKRIILKYFDEYAQKFFDIVPGRFGYLSGVPKSKCTSFKYFLTNVAPDMNSVFFDNPPQITAGRIFNANATDMCIDTSGQTIGAVLALKNCTENPKSSVYSVTKAFDIRLPSKNLCWDASDPFKYQGTDVSLVTLQPCNTLDHKQKFDYDLKSKIIKKIGTNFCLDAIVKRKFVALSYCDEKVLMQRWHFH